MLNLRSLVLVGVCAVAACGSKPYGSGGTEEGNGTWGGGSDPNGGGFGTGGGGSGGPIIPPDFKPPMTSDAGAPISNKVGCRNIDLVFSIDNSSSMTEEQMAMGTKIFPAFAMKLQQLGGSFESFRVGTLDACPRPANFNTRGKGGACNFSSGKPWIDSKSTKLVQEFQCVGAIDSTGKTCTGNNDDEQPASTAAASLEAPAITGPNAGFLRKDAVLVVLAMTDEDEQPMYTTATSAKQVHDRILALKGNDPKMVVFLGIAGSKMCTGPYGTASDARTMKAITQMFVDKQRGVFWDLCAGSLDEGLGRAIDVIKLACNEAPFIP